MTPFSRQYHGTHLNQNYQNSRLAGEGVDVPGNVVAIR